MATPVLTRNTDQLPTISYNTAQVLDFGIVKDAAGDAIDISSGYSASFDVLYDNRVGGLLTAKSGTFSYGADGSLKLALTQTQAGQIAPGFYQGRVWVSNDSGTTTGTHQGGNFTVQYP